MDKFKSLNVHRIFVTHTCRVVNPENNCSFPASELPPSLNLPSHLKSLRLSLG